MADGPLPVVMDVMPGRGTRGILVPAIFALLVTGLAFFIFQALSISFVFAIQLFVIVFVVDILAPVVFTYVRLGKAQKIFPIVIAAVEAILVVVLLAALLVYQGVWISATGGLTVTILLTTASLAVGAATFIGAFVAYNWKLVI